MKKNAILWMVMLTIVNVLPALAQKNETSHAWLKTGSKLTYHLVNVTREYDFIITNLVMDKDIVFSWAMTDPVNYSGKIKIPAEAIDTAHTMVNYFADGSDQNLQGKTTVWVSRAVYKSMKAGTQVIIILDRKPEILSFKRMETAGIVVDGVEVKLDVLVCETDAGNVIKILDNPRWPLIIKLETAFMIELKSVETVKN